MDGKGYPRQLSGKQMSVPARMMAVADVFEALTAADRPYKKAKTLSQALWIMAHMRDDGHIDGDIFELFVSAGIYETYADRFLDRGQIDAVDPARYLPDHPGDGAPSQRQLIWLFLPDKIIRALIAHLAYIYLLGVAYLTQSP